MELLEQALDMEQIYTNFSAIKVFSNDKEQINEALNRVGSKFFTMSSLDESTLLTHPNKLARQITRESIKGDSDDGKNFRKKGGKFF